MLLILLKFYWELLKSEIFIDSRAVSLIRDPHLKYMNVNPDANFKMIDLLMENFDEMDMSPGNFWMLDNLSATFFHTIIYGKAFV